jgi:bifunctional ADP-heptose synthase (sugar kinase/adenylyltransferase)
MVDGSFDPLHDGHIRYFAFAASLGLPVFCNIASDDWTSAKHAILLEQEKRAVVIDAVRFIDYVYCADTSTADVLRLVRPRKYVKGADWRDRGGVPEVETAICDEFGIEIVYANTEMNSSSRILKRFSGHHE